jgi:hypothetical protein
MDQFRVITLEAQVRYDEFKAFCIFVLKNTGGELGEEDRPEDIGNVSDPEL